MSVPEIPDIGRRADQLSPAPVRHTRRHSLRDCLRGHAPVSGPRDRASQADCERLLTVVGDVHWDDEQACTSRPPLLASAAVSPGQLGKCQGSSDETGVDSNAIFCRSRRAR